MVRIKEIFPSIQGEGPYVGYKQLFVRFCNCNLKCNYCDTEFDGGVDYSPCALADEVNKYTDIHSVSLTGGEPLLQADFLKDFLPRVNKKIYLETNATLADKFLEVKPFIDIVSADIKLESAAGIKDTYKFHDKFFEACRGVETFAKIVFNEKITGEEVDICCNLGKKYGIELILQPMMISCRQTVIANECEAIQPIYDNICKMSVTSEFCTETLKKFLARYEKVRLIPQVHKFLDVR